MSVNVLPQPCPTGPSPKLDPRRYQPTLPHLPDTARTIFRDYSQIPEDQILDHIYRVRAAAWDMYVCISHALLPRRPYSQN